MELNSREVRKSKSLQEWSWALIKWCCRHRRLMMFLRCARKWCCSLCSQWCYVCQCAEGAPHREAASCPKDASFARQGKHNWKQQVLRLAVFLCYPTEKDLLDFCGGSWTHVTVYCLTKILVFCIALSCSGWTLGSSVKQDINRNRLLFYQQASHFSLNSNRTMGFGS